MNKTIDKKTKSYTSFITDLAPLLEKHNVKDLLIIANTNGQIRNTYLPATGVEDPFFCTLSDAIHEILQRSGAAQRDKKSFAIGKELQFKTNSKR